MNCLMKGHYGKIPPWSPQEATTAADRLPIPYRVV